MKTCTRCKEEKSEKLFYSNCIYCKSCRKLIGAKSREKKRAEALNILKDMINEGRLEL